MKKATVILSILFAIHLKGNGQILITERNTNQLAYINLGLEPEVITTVGYVHSINYQTDNKYFFLGASIKSAPMITKNKASRFNVTQALFYPLSIKWNSYLHNDIFIAHNENHAGKMTSLGFEIACAMLTNRKKWNKGFELGFQDKILYTPSPRFVSPRTDTSLSQVHEPALQVTPSKLISQIFQKGKIFYTCFIIFCR